MATEASCTHGSAGRLDPNGRFRVRIREIQRRLIRFLGGRSERDVEYDFAYRNIGGHGLRILDIGGCDSLLPLFLARENHLVTVFDFRPYPERHPNLQVMRGDFLRNTLRSASFDVVVLVSTIEHFGMGAYGAPESPEADFVVMEESRRLLVREGHLILTFPFHESEKIIPGFEHWYTPERVASLLGGWQVYAQEFWEPEKQILGRWVKWRPTTMRAAAQAYARTGLHGLACFAVGKSEVKR